MKWAILVGLMVMSLFVIGCTQKQGVGSDYSAVSANGCYLVNSWVQNPGIGCCGNAIATGVATGKGARVYCLPVSNQ